MHNCIQAVRSFIAGERLNQRGQVLPLVLVFMMLGGLLIAPSLDFMSTGLKSGRLVERHVQELYAADAGVEHGLWQLKNMPPATYPYSYQLADVNGMPVNITIATSNVLWGFSLGPSGVHIDNLLLHATMTWDATFNNYRYTLVLTNTAGSNVKVDYILITPPAGFSYVSGSTSGLTTTNPDVAGDPNGSMGLIWDFDTPRPSIPAAPNSGKGIYSTVYHYLRLTGAAGYTGAPGFIWIGAERQDVGTISTAVAMKVTAQAMRGTTAAATASALVLVDGSTGAILIGSWQVN